MRQRASSTRSETKSAEDGDEYRRCASARSDDTGATLEQQCRRLERLVGELLLKNEALRRRMAGYEE